MMAYANTPVFTVALRSYSHFLTLFFFFFLIFTHRIGQYHSLREEMSPPLLFVKY